MANREERTARPEWLTGFEEVVSIPTHCSICKELATEEELLDGNHPDC